MTWHRCHRHLPFSLVIFFSCWHVMFMLAGQQVRGENPEWGKHPERSAEKDFLCTTSIVRLGLVVPSARYWIGKVNNLPIHRICGSWVVANNRNDPRTDPLQHSGRCAHFLSTMKCLVHRILWQGRYRSLALEPQIGQTEAGLCRKTFPPVCWGGQGPDKRPIYGCL
jgi:hypothetical protein